MNKIKAKQQSSGIGRAGRRSNPAALKKAGGLVLDETDPKIDRFLLDVWEDFVLHSVQGISSMSMPSGGGGAGGGPKGGGGGNGPGSGGNGGGNGEGNGNNGGNGGGSPSSPTPSDPGPTPTPPSSVTNPLPAPTNGNGNGNGGNGNGGGGSPSSPTIDCSSLTREEAYQLVLLAVTDGPVLANPTTPQGMALRFLLNDDAAQLDPCEVPTLVQRYALATIYFSTDGEDWENNDRWLSGSDECNWYGIECSGGEVTDIDLCKY